MYSKTSTIKYTEDFSDKIQKLKNAIHDADAVLIGAGAGLSTSAGLTYSGERFERYFGDFAQKYGTTDIYSGGFYPYKTLEEYWAWWSRHIYYNRFETPKSDVYTNLLKLVSDKEYFVLTTNVDHQFQLAGCDKSRLFYTQGDYGLWQCSKPCHQSTYDNEETVCKMIAEQKEMRVPTELIPMCPKCGSPMTMNLRCDETFVQDEGWYAAAERYNNFVRKYATGKLLLLDLGVGGNTPGIIKYPFWKMTARNPEITYACINLYEAVCPKQIENQSLCFNADIAEILETLI